MALATETAAAGEPPVHGGPDNHGPGNGPDFAKPPPPAIATWRERLVAWWTSLSLADQFLRLGSAVLVVGMALIGFWVAERIKQGVVSNTAAATALFMDSFVAPLVQELAVSDELSPAAVDRLDRLLTETSIGQRVASIKIWKRGGVVVYSNWKDLIGRKFAPSAGLRGAWNGTVTGSFDSDSHPDDERERLMRKPLIEIYSPVRAANTERIIAVSEFYERADDLRHDLRRATAWSWIVVGLVTALMLSALYVIVLRGSRMIESQRSRLEEQVAELHRLLGQNIQLRSRVERAHRRSADMNERFLRRVGSDLHDGPAQLLGLALLRLDGISTDLRRGEDGGIVPRGQQNLEAIRAALADALKEVRSLSAGLALPELDAVSLNEAIAIAVRAHERRTGSQVAVAMQDLPDETPRRIKVCLFRFLQEALSNAWRHAGGVGQSVEARLGRDGLVVVVADRGPGLGDTVETKGESTSGLGLPGLRDRIEALGGSFEVITARNEGTRLVARFSEQDLRKVEAADD